MKIEKWTDKPLLRGADPVYLKGTNKTGILLFHGWSSTPQELNPDYVPSTAKYLNSLGYTVYVPLRLGHGTNPKDLDGIHWEDWVEEAHKHFEWFSKRVDRVIVGGMSMGAQLAFKIAEKNKVAGIIAMGMPIFLNMDPLFRVWAWVNRNNHTLFTKRYVPRDKEIAMRKVHYIQYPAYHLYENAKASWEIRKTIPKITVPTLIIHALKDNVVDPISAKYVFKKIGSKDKKIFWVKDSYHSFTTDRHSRRASRVMGDFVNRVTKQ